MTDAAPRPQKAPAGLDKAGRALWRSITAVYRLDPRESTLLAAAARQADLVADLEGALAKSTLVVSGSQGQPVLNGMVAEVRQGRLALGRLLGTLDLPAEPGASSKTPGQLRAKKASDTRWDLQRQRIGRRSSGPAA